MHHFAECALTAAISGGAGLAGSTLKALHTMHKVEKSLHVLIAIFTCADILSSAYGIREAW